MDRDRVAAQVSPARAGIERKLIVFKHDSPYGKAPSHRRFEAVTVRRKDGVEASRAFSDYEVALDRGALPDGVQVLERV